MCLKHGPGGHHGANQTRLGAEVADANIRRQRTQIRGAPAQGLDESGGLLYEAAGKNEGFGIEQGSPAAARGKMPPATVPVAR